MGASPSRVYTTAQVEEMERRNLEREDSEMDDYILPTNKYDSFARFALIICCTVGIITAILFISLVTAAELASYLKS
ncbi:hypothetical protein GCK72_022962 [Caenorhabditis remanei]|uniref:Uncharacterized protein n=3 Tax=Caenorhabditis TaxID=6237 RepID=E3N8E7_CAERE|nr:hypothetical protein GCK72_022962 [Caenorhabditis remanei]EFO89428.1 hypothetical protein CRE_19943 [Caenorhabditis remanei]KAF1746506.1 hypothetical protein GCK72_022962 [Caenorhabditis remanei]